MKFGSIQVGYQISTNIYSTPKCLANSLDLTPAMCWKFTYKGTLPTFPTRATVVFMVATGGKIS